MDFAGAEFNLVDLIAFFIILVSVIGGIKQGFIGGFMDLLGLIAAIYFSFKGYRPVWGLLSELLSVPAGIGNLLTFIGLFVAIQVLFSIVFGFIVRGVRRFVRLFPVLHFADALAGTLPGLVKGVVGVTILLLPFGLFPIFPEAKAEIENSYSGRKIIGMASEVAPRLESFLGQAAEDTLIFVSRPEPGKVVKLNLPIPSEISIDAGSEEKMLELVNAERVKAGLQPLVVDEKLRQAARGHSEEMFLLSYFAHDSPSGTSPADRMRAEGARFTAAAENLAYAPNVEMAHNGLMNSAGHRKNILTPGLKRIGIGVIDGGLRGKMFTQNFTD